jgi:hypothetical protein
MPNTSFLLQTVGTTSNTSSVNNGTIPTSTCLSCDSSYPNPTNSCIPPPIYPPGQPTSNPSQFYSNPDNMYAAWYSYQETTTVANGNTNYTTQPLTSVSYVGPKNIYIIRHGEKKQCSSGYCLDYNGAKRACNLVTYFNSFPEPIDYIVTCNPCLYDTSNSSMRPSQTIFPTSFMLNIPTSVYGGAQDFYFVADALFENSTNNPYNGMNVLICWEHSAIQGLMLTLLNKAGEVGRLPLVTDVGDASMYGSKFFKELADPTNPSVTSSDHSYKITDGYFLSTSTSPGGKTGTPYQVDLSTNLPLPTYVDASDSQYYPYWNSGTFNLLYNIGTASDSSVPNELNVFDIHTQPINTCYQSNTKRIGLYQPLTESCTPSNSYYTSSDNIEDNDIIPSAWAT